ncbi:MAG: DUF1573 domain-containing protein [Sedimentisphaerales bacterium]|nr:DUF1573 domain-containing protein [Sedimentisphaerales bacterium]
MNFKYVLICIACLGIFFITGCHKQAKDLPATATSSAMVVASAKIQFEATDCNLGSIGPRTKHTCTFKFKNTGTGTLEIKEVAKSGSCAHFTPDRTQYQPGESGVVELRYNATERLGEISEQWLVTTNDPQNSKIPLTIRVVVEDKVFYEPRHLTLALNEKNAGLPAIVLASTDGRAFSIRGFNVMGECITADVNTSLRASQFELHPTADMEKMRKTLAGHIIIWTDHPECEKVIIPFEAMPEFKVTPVAMTVVNAEPNKSIERQFEVSSNYGEAFEIESVSSANGFVKITEQQKTAKGYQFKVKITPPAKNPDTESFKDTVQLTTKDGRHIEIACTGFYAQSK